MAPTDDRFRNCTTSCSAYEWSGNTFDDTMEAPGAALTSYLRVVAAKPAACGSRSTRARRSACRRPVQRRGSRRRRPPSAHRTAVRRERRGLPAGRPPSPQPLPREAAGRRFHPPPADCPGSGVSGSPHSPTCCCPTSTRTSPPNTSRTLRPSTTTWPWSPRRTTGRGHGHRRVHRSQPERRRPDRSRPCTRSAHRASKGSSAAPVAHRHQGHPHSPHCRLIPPGAAVSVVPRYSPPNGSLPPMIRSSHR